MEMNTRYNYRISRRQTAECKQICAKDERNASFRKVTSILQKPVNNRTSEELEILVSYSDIVNEVRQRMHRRTVVKQRLEEVEEPPDELISKCRTLAQCIRDSQHLVIYTGAGISTAARIPDYRGTNGIWTRLQQGKDIGKHDLSLAEPTYTHMALSTLYHRGLLKYVVSQNCDGLHLRSGLPKSALSELHGNMSIEVCKSCKPHREYWRLFDVTENTARYSHKTMRRCYVCNNALVDTIVHFGERGTLQWPLNWQGACKNADKADTIICLGSSLKVLKKYPWLWLMDKPAKKRPNLYIVNLQWTPKDEAALMKIHGKCDAVMKIIMSELGIAVNEYQRQTDPIFIHATPITDVELHTNTQPELQSLSCTKFERKDESLTENCCDAEVKLEVEERKELKNCSGTMTGSEATGNIKTLETNNDVPVVKEEINSQESQVCDKKEHFEIISTEKLLVSNSFSEQNTMHNEKQHRTDDIEKLNENANLFFCDKLNSNMNGISSITTALSPKNTIFLKKESPIKDSIFAIDNILSCGTRKRSRTLLERPMQRFIFPNPSHAQDYDSNQQIHNVPVKSENSSNNIQLLGSKSNSLTVDYNAQLQTLLSCYHAFANPLLHNQYSLLNPTLYPYQTSFLYPGLHSIINPSPYLHYDFQEQTTTLPHTQPIPIQYIHKSTSLMVEQPLIPTCSFCYENYKSYVCLFYTKYTPTFEKVLYRFSKSQNENKPIFCECCDYSSSSETEEELDKKDSVIVNSKKIKNTVGPTDDNIVLSPSQFSEPLEPIVESDGGNNDDVSKVVTATVKVTRPGWFGKGYRKNRRTKKR